MLPGKVSSPAMVHQKTSFTPSLLYNERGSTVTIKPSKALYIKLGRGDEWARECIEVGYLRLGFSYVTHKLCAQGEWDSVKKELIETHHKSTAKAANIANQIKHFYESGEDTLWVTFFGDRLWWCFSKSEITFLSKDKSKTRPVIGQWSSSDTTEKPLRKNRLSGKFLSMQGFQGTICSVKEFEYLIQKINGVEPPKVKEARGALLTLEQKIEDIIRALYWKDFEVLIDLIFRQAGWQRLSELGGTMKDLDLDLVSPITAERYGVQIKSQANIKTFEEYQQKFADMQGFTRFYFVVHTPSDELSQATKTEDVELLLPENIAHLAVKYGLTDWIIDKAR
jgi:hypothetical protein